MKRLPGARMLVLMTVLLAAAVSAQEQQNQEQFVLIDVRSPQEFRQGHIEGAINIPHTEIAHQIEEVASDRFQAIHLYGATGTFAGLALEILMELGYQYVVNEGSYEALLERRQNQ